MKVKINETLLGYDGDPIEMQEGGTDPFALTLRKACCMALLRAMSSQQCEGLEKMERFDLCRRIYEADDDIELKAEEIVLLKSVSGEFFLPGVMGPIWLLLEGTQ